LVLFSVRLLAGWFSRRVCFVRIGFLVSGLAFLFAFSSRAVGGFALASFAFGSCSLFGVFGASCAFGSSGWLSRLRLARFCLGVVLMSALVGFCGSRSWASVSLAVGLGVPVVVFPCVPAGVSPLSVLPSSWSGSWVTAGSGVWSSGFRFVPSVSSLLPF